MSQCNDPKVVTHEVEWQSQQCVDGGIFRALRNYTNLATSGFNTDVGYSGHYYGIRKFTGLAPESAYFVTVKGKTGSAGRIEVPREIYEWEYGSNNNVDYSGVKLIDNNFRFTNGYYGKSVSSKEDYLAVGVPYYSFEDDNGYLLEKAGTVLLYKRNPQPSGYDWSNQYDKGEWVFETNITLPSGLLKDFISEKIKTKFLPNIVKELPFEVEKNIWKVGQNGRQLGHSVDLCITDNILPSLGENKKNILVVGAPSSKFDREFEDSVASGVNVGLFVFTDNFVPEVKIYPPGRNYPDVYDYNWVANGISDIDLLFRYFCDPPTKFNIKVNIIECLVIEDTKEIYNFSEPKPTFINKSVTNRHSRITNPNSIQFSNTDDQIFESIKNAFFETFPYDETKLNNNIPAILGFYIDNTFSFGGKRAISPALDRFIDFYQSYALASGLKDFFDIPSTGYTFQLQGDDDLWPVKCVNILKNTLDTDSLLENNAFKLFSSGVGTFNSNIEELNDPPSSGGTVFIFEKESGSWNLIQIIDSPTKLNDVYPDRFGHDVKISDNGEIIVIGSPYIEKSVLAYEYNPTAKETIYLYLESWLLHRKNKETEGSEYLDLYNKFIEYKNLYGSEAIIKFYLEQLSQLNKYKLRSDSDFWGNNPIQEYQETFSYSSNITGGAWSFLVKDFAPNSRLGYSVAVNEDGSIIAAGAPTDSLNEFDDSASYYAPERPQYTTWHSYVNTGAVRVFESRKYFPHNTVVDYRKFGNLDYETSPSGEKQFFTHLRNVYQNIGLNFIETEFVDTNIPEEAGLLFINTPQVNALSNEVLEKIRNWLALGDRNLVLVGNDPIWEKDGLFFESNEIVNLILEKLNSRLRILPARNQYEALSRNQDSCVQNIIPSFRPTNSLQTYISTQTLRGYGVGDIKPYWEPANLKYDCGVGQAGSVSSLSSFFGQQLTYATANSKCEIPIKHLGDLRSEWRDWCISSNFKPITYPINWPLFFGTINPSYYGCFLSDGNEFKSPTSGYDGVPILVAAEYPPPFNVTYPAVPASSGLFQIARLVPSNDFTFSFSSTANNETSFIWNSTSGNFNYFNDNISSSVSDTKFFDPPLYNNKDGLLQAKASSRIQSSVRPKIVSDKAYFAAESNYNNTSKIYLIAGTYTEESRILSDDNLSLGISSGSDRNIAFYFNIVAKDINGNANIAQLSDWTGRTNFTDLNNKSILQVVFEQTYNNIDINVSVDNLLKGKSFNDGSWYDYDVCWIVEPINLPNDLQIEKIKQWLDRGNKKIVITYSSDEPEVLNRIGKLCEIFESPMKPLFLINKGRYADSQQDFSTLTTLSFNQNSFVSKGFSERNTSIISLPYFSDVKYIPIELNGAIPICFSDFPVFDDDFISTGFWEIKSGIAKVTFPVLPGSGYILFITTASEHFSENQKLNFYINNASRIPSDNLLGVVNNPIFDFDLNNNKFIIPDETYSIPVETNIDFFDGNLTHNSINFQVPFNKNEFSIYIDANNLRLNTNTTDYIPKTTRLIAISGCLLPIESKRGSIFVYDDEWRITQEAQPETTITITPEVRPISTDNSKYCPSQDCISQLGNKLIADGPVVVAQELEIFSNFEYGVNRSRITVISDSSLVQGKCIADEDGRIYQENIAFLRSLYPYTNFPSQTRGRSFTDHITKIQSPERLTPQRLFHSNGNIGNNLNFQISGIAASGKNMIEFIESFDNYELFIPAFNVRYGNPPEYTEKRPEPITEEQALLEESGIIKEFRKTLKDWGAFTKFAGVIEDKYYEDTGPVGGVPEIMKDTGFDYLDFNRFPSGYPGDLFGYSIDIYKNKILIGSPFAGYNKEELTNWSDVANNTSQYSNPSGTLTGYNGGAGAVYLYERSNNATTPFGKPSRWGCSRKFRPHDINIGQDTDNLDLFSSGAIFGENNYKSDDLSLTIVNDQFGHSVKIYSDIIAIGAPGHDFENYIQTIYNSGSFIRKAFGSSFDIPQRIIYDLGSSGIRISLENSGVAILNNGAVYTYENRLSDWQNKKQSWEFIQKIVPQGYNSRKQKTYTESSEIPNSGSENDRFGSILTINRSQRSDSDYSLIIGTPIHKFGNNSSEEIIENGGTVYIYDGVLRRMPYSNIDENSFIQARVFGFTDISGYPSVRLGFFNDPANTNYSSSGLIYSNINGDIFLEVSGQDTTNKTYIIHRPFIESINGSYIFGDPLDNGINLFIDGEPQTSSGNMNLFSSVPDSAIVYNELGLYESAILGIASGIPSGLSLFTNSPDPIEISDSGLMLYASGTGFNPETLNLRVRGK